MNLCPRCMFSSRKLIFAIVCVASLMSVLMLRTALHGLDRLNITNVEMQRFHPYNPSMAANVHLFVISMGEETLMMFTQTIKSICASRNNRQSYTVYFHLVCKRADVPSLKSIFDTWNLYNVKYKLYVWEDTPLSVKKDISQLKTKHYSGEIAFIRLVIPELLSQDITKVISIDTDMIFLGDVQELWTEFDKFNEKQIIGMIEDEVDTNSNWPYGKRLLNGGLIMMDIAKMRRINWRDIWVPSTMKNYEKYGIPVFGEQCVLNALMVLHPELLYKPPCSWNRMLNGDANNDNCLSGWEAGLTPPKVLHMNAHPKPKFPSETPIITHFFSSQAIGENPFTLRLRYKYFTMFYHNYDAYSLADPLPKYTPESHSHCQPVQHLVKVLPWASYINECITWHLEQYQLKRHFVNFIRPTDTESGNGITLVTQFHVNELSRFLKLMDEWKGTISAAVYGADSDLWDLELARRKNPLFSKRQNVAVHIVYKNGVLYPVNTLLNVAYNNSRTPLVLLLENVSIRLPENTESLLNHNIEVFNKEKTVWILNHKVVGKTHPDLQLKIQTLTYEEDLPSSPMIMRKYPTLQFDERFYKYTWAYESIMYMMHQLGHSFKRILNLNFILTRTGSERALRKHFKNVLYKKSCIDELKRQFHQYITCYVKSIEV